MTPRCKDLPLAGALVGSPEGLGAGLVGGPAAEDDARAAALARARSMLSRQF